VWDGSGGEGDSEEKHAVFRDDGERRGGSGSRVAQRHRLKKVKVKRALIFTRRRRVHT
jgi:hypothetical protein